MSLNLDARFARRSLAFFPSPLQKLERLSAALGVEVWAKRDDVSSGLAYGGNKIRKLEWLVADAMEKGCDTLVSIGGVQSNHTRQVAAAAAACGLKCRLVQEHWAEWEDPVYDKVGNILLSRLMGAKAVLEGEGVSVEIKETWLAALEEVRREGGTPYAIPAGASDHPLGGLGYANFADELAEQEKDLGFRFDTVVTATGTGSTQGGMVTGFKSQDRPRTLIGIDTLADAEASHAATLKSARQTAETIGLNDPIEAEDVIVDGRFAGPAYGIPDETTIAAIRMAAELEAMITDPVYEGKSMAALIAMAREGAIAPGSRVLYVHLGGSPALHAYHKAFH